MIKEGENAIDGQDASNQQAQNQQSGSGNDSKEDTMIDSGNNCSNRRLIMDDC
jgi:hypothetical protein